MGSLELTFPSAENQIEKERFEIEVVLYFENTHTRRHREREREYVRVYERKLQQWGCEHGEEGKKWSLWGKGKVVFSLAKQRNQSFGTID